MGIIKESGGEKHKDLLISDHEEFYSEVQSSEEDVQNTERRDTRWLTSDTAMPTKVKLSQLGVAYRHTGHGSSMTDLKIWKKILPKTACSINE